MNQKAYVIGHPIAQSRSPMMHSYWMKHHGIDGTYDKLDVPPDELAGFFERFRKDRYIGANVTIPHKLAVMDHVDRIDDLARDMGAVNCIWWEGEELVGGNTDALGVLGNIDEKLPGWDAKAKRAVVLGAGGAARAATYGLRMRRLDVVLCNRTVAKAEALAKHFGGNISVRGLQDLPELMRDADILINTTSLGMIGQPPLDLDLSALGPEAIVYDVVYVPLATELLGAAKKRGLRTIDGLGMLLHQGVVGFEHWFGVRPAVTKELRQLLENDIRAKTPGA